MQNAGRENAYLSFKSYCEIEWVNLNIYLAKLNGISVSLCEYTMYEVQSVLNHKS